MNKLFTLTALACLGIGTLCAQVRTEVLLDKGWRFSRNDDAQQASVQYNDNKWQQVTVPHDWAIYGPFDRFNDLQTMAITQDGQANAMEHAGRTGGLPFVGTGWYRLAFDAGSFEQGKTATLIFDGAMSHATVYVNGHEAGYWPYGYNSFYVDATPYMHPGINQLAVRLENPTEFSRWYPGAGLYRNVHYVVNQAAHIPTWGTCITTPIVGKDLAQVQLQAKVVLPAGDDAAHYRLKTQIKNPQGQVVAQAENSVSAYNNKLFEQEFKVNQPALWSVDTPNLYVAESKLYKGSELCDEYITRFGIRSIELVGGKGFYLNGELVKFKGVCNHHDLGPLGGEVNMAAIRRQIRLLKDMGCNAIRTSHNMPAPELVQACDEMGMMLMAESFDEWITPKMANGYNKVYYEWVEKDLVNLIHQFRNNPSIMMWCIGNEVPDQDNVKNGAKLARMMQDICHREDPTRPVTQGMDNPDAVLKNNIAAMMDIPGFNYRPHRYQEAFDRLPHGFLLGSETASTVSSRGVYKFPVKRGAMVMYDDHQSSSYDVECCSWSNLPEDDWIWQDCKDWTMGEFVWTGFDYLGEPTPYYTNWPSHSSLFGIIDLASLPKDRFYLYRSRWNEKEETLHILPHWTWPGREGQVTPVFVYTNYPTAELFINGKSQGKRTKDLSVTVENSADKESQESFKRQKRYRLMWMDTVYEPGTVKVVAYNEKGEAVAEQQVVTAGKPHHVELVADRDSYTADGKDLAFLTVKVVDKDGNLCPDADCEIRYNVKGAGKYRAGANGNSVSLELFHQPQMKVFSGMMTAIVQTTEVAGTISVTASAKGLQPGKIILKSE